MSPPTLETRRLTLRPFGPEDLESLHLLHSETSFWKFPLGRGFSRSETEAFLERTFASYDDLGFGLSAVVIRDTQVLAGWAGLAVPSFLPELLPAVEVGWRLGRSFWGLGYATEAGAAWVRYGFAELGLARIVSICQPENVASFAVMERLGFHVERRTVHPTMNVPLIVTEIHAPGSGSGE